MGDQAMIYFSFDCDWFREWCKVFWSNNRVSDVKQSNLR